MPPAPFYFERVAILAAKAKNYQLEVSSIESFLQTVEIFYLENMGVAMADIRNGPRYQAIQKRLTKANERLHAQKLFCS